MLSKCYRTISKWLIRLKNYSNPHQTPQNCLPFTTIHRFPRYHRTWFYRRMMFDVLFPLHRWSQESLIISQSEQGKSINPMTTTNRFSRRFVLDGEINLASFYDQKLILIEFNMILFDLLYLLYRCSLCFYDRGWLSLHCTAPSVTFFIAFWEDIPRGRRRRRRCQDGQQLQEGLTSEASPICTTLKTLMDFWFGSKTRPPLPT